MPGGFVVGDFVLTFPISALEQHQPDGILTSQWPPVECPSPSGLDARLRRGVCGVSVAHAAVADARDDPNVERGL